MAEWQSGRMAEWRNGGWRNDGMAEGGTAEWRKGYIPNLPDIFTVHADTDVDTDNDDTLIIYSIDLASIQGPSLLIIEL